MSVEQPHDLHAHPGLDVRQLEVMPHPRSWRVVASLGLVTFGDQIAHRIDRRRIGLVAERLDPLVEVAALLGAQARRLGVAEPLDREIGEGEHGEGVGQVDPVVEQLLDVYRLQHVQRHGGILAAGCHSERPDR